MSVAAPENTAPAWIRHCTPSFAVILVLAAALALAHGQIFGAGADQVVAVAPSSARESLHPLRSADVRLEAWLVARHAHALLREPWRLFETPHCAPERHTLTLGVPSIALGVLGIPAAIASHEPLLVYNWARVASNAVCALAMYCLVTGWTGRRAAGLATSLLFAFHSFRPDLASHPPEWDIAWTVLALHFAQRLLSGGHWRDAVGLGLCGALQVAASFYALVAATLLSLPLGSWLILRRVARRASPTQIAAVAACIALSAVLLLGPYLAARRTGQIGGRTDFFYAAADQYASAARPFPGSVVLVAALLGLAAPRRLAWSGVGGDPRPALFAAAALVAFTSAGSNTARSLRAWGLPVPDFDPYALLARIIPGLDSVRDVTLLGTAVYLVACVLAGAGFAAVINAAGRRAAASAAIVALAGLACFGSGRKEWLLEVARPEPALIGFFEELARLGNAGPLLELPLDSASDGTAGVGVGRMLLHAWHGRRTSACFASFQPPSRQRLDALASRLPDREAVDALRALGFTTLITHHPARIGPWLDQKYERASSGPDATLRRLAQIDTASAYELVAHQGSAP